MSVRASAWAWSVELPAPQKLVLLALADHCNDEDFTCWPSVTHLTRKTGLGRRTVFRCLDQLVGLGFVTRHAREGKQTTLYTLCVNSARAALMPERHQCRSGTSAGEARASATAAPPLVPQRHTESSIEPPRNQISTPDGVEGDKQGPPPCPHDKIIEIYHAILPQCPQVRVWNKKRRGLLKTRWREDPERQSIDWWEKFFRYVSRSDFLTGKVLGRDGEPKFMVDLEWLVGPQNFVKVIEGKYENRRGRREP